MIVSRKHLTFFILGIALVLALAIFCAPSLLLVSEAPVKSDAVVLFLGGEKGTREKEAYQLIREGFAEYLLIPARGQIQKMGPDGRLVRLDLTALPNTSHLKPKTVAWLEDTHEEAILAREMMARLGINSAILVSSPYHMRRIRLIADHVFKSAPSSEKEGQDGFKLYAVPTRYETPGDGFWLFNSYERKFVLKEYSKLVWFIVYASFTAGPQ